MGVYGCLSTIQMVLVCASGVNKSLCENMSGYALLPCFLPIELGSTGFLMASLPWNTCFVGILVIEKSMMTFY